MADGPPARVFLRSLVGILGGVSATGPMTIGMIRCIAYSQKGPLRTPTLRNYGASSQCTGCAGEVRPQRLAPPQLDQSLRLWGHGGHLFALRRADPDTPPVLKGPLFGALVWLMSYLGLLPATGILQPATRQPVSRNALMFVVRLLWGLFVGVFVDTLLSEKRASSERS
jgi:hypothetical protein